jgi:cytoskeletal protein RodZ
VEESESLGRYLKKERESKGVSLKEVSISTKVKEHLLKAIEEDQYTSLPSPPYIKGFLLSYAKYLGLDPHDVYLRYEDGLRRRQATRLEAPPAKKILWEKKYLWMIGGILVLGVGLLGSYLIFLHPPQPAIESVPVAPKAEEPPPPSPQIAETPPAPEEQPFSLQLKAVEETWVRIQINGQPEHEMTLQPGETTSHQALKQIQLLVGNAGGLDILFNGKLLERFGKSGEVVDLTFTPKGLEKERHAIPKPKPEE